MKPLPSLAAIAAVATAFLASPSHAALKVGASAPEFTAPAYLAGEPFTYKLADALKKGPVVLYFFPAAETKGCNLEAKLFADATAEFKANGATVIGVTSGNLDKLQAFSADTEKCAGKFPVAADPGAKIAKSFDSVMAMKPDWSDRTSYVISPAGQVVHVYSKMDPSQHVAETLGAVKTWKATHKK